MKQVICGNLKGTRIRQSLLQPCVHQTGMQVPWKVQQLEAGVRDCRAIPGQGLLLTAERGIQEMWGRRLWWEIPVEESQAAMEAGQTCSMAALLLSPLCRCHQPSSCACLHGWASQSRICGRQNWIIKSWGMLVKGLGGRLHTGLSRLPAAGWHRQSSDSVSQHTPTAECCCFFSVGVRAH